MNITSTKRIVLAVVMIAIFAAAGCLGPKPVALGDEAYRSGDYATALQQYQLGVDAGDPEAMFALALLYADGKGVNKDAGRARKLLEESAIQGNALAATTLGVYSYYGVDTKQDYKLAAAFFSLAAYQGEPLAIDYLSYMMENGIGVEKNPALAEALKDYVNIP